MEYFEKLHERIKELEEALGHYIDPDEWRYVKRDGHVPPMWCLKTPDWVKDDDELYHPANEGRSVIGEEFERMPLDRDGNEYF